MCIQLSCVKNLSTRVALFFVELYHSIKANEIEFYATLPSLMCAFINGCVKMSLLTPITTPPLGSR